MRGDALKRFAEYEAARKRERLWGILRGVGCFGLAMIMLAITTAIVVTIVKTIWSAAPNG